MHLHGGPGVRRRIIVLRVPSVPLLHLSTSLVRPATCWLTAECELASWLSVRVTARRVNAAQLDEACHEQNEADTHEHHSPPVLLDPF